MNDTDTTRLTFTRRESSYVARLTYQSDEISWKYSSLNAKFEPKGRIIIWLSLFGNNCLKPPDFRWSFPLSIKRSCTRNSKHGNKSLHEKWRKEIAVVCHTMLPHRLPERLKFKRRKFISWFFVVGILVLALASPRSNPLIKIIYFWGSV